MAVTLRLMRLGKKSSPSYRIVVIDRHKKRNGAYIEIIGHYDPLRNPAAISLNQKKITSWLKKGAVLSEGLSKLLKIKTLKKDYLSWDTKNQ